MTPRPLVTVIITCYNIRDYLEDAICSVLNQTYDNLEIIVVDDGSTDGTDELMRSYRMALVYLEKVNGGPSSARNYGVARARGEFVAFLDGDDIWERFKLEQQVAVLSTHTELGMVFSDFSTFDEAGTVVTEKNKSMFCHLEPLAYEYLVDRNNFIYPSTVLIRKKVLDQVGGFDESLRGPEDWDLWLRIVRYAAIAGIHAPLARIRQHATNISGIVLPMLENERRAIENQRAFLSSICFRKRLARLYLLNADRSIHSGQRIQALVLVCKGMIIFPFHLIPLCIVLVKFFIGGKLMVLLRRAVDGNRLFRQCFELLYRKY
jgi:glycosyltransferase involved in cell wall biosynthesis